MYASKHYSLSHSKFRYILLKCVNQISRTICEFSKGSLHSNTYKEKTSISSSKSTSCFSFPPSFHHCPSSNICNPTIPSPCGFLNWHKTHLLQPDFFACSVHVLLQGCSYIVFTVHLIFLLLHLFLLFFFLEM